MKKIFILFALYVPQIIYAAEPSTSCPIGYTAISEYDVIITASSCPSGYVSAGTTTSCLISNPATNCTMYVPPNTPYTDIFGEYEFVEPCPL